MFSDNISLNDATPTSRTFVKIPSGNSQETRRIDNSTTLAAPRYMVFRHGIATQGKAREVVDKHTLVFTKDQLSTAGNPITTSHSTTSTIPRDTAGLGAIDDLKAFTQNFFSVAGNWTSFKLGEA